MLEVIGDMPRGVYSRQKKSLADRLWPKVRIGAPDECWPFLGRLTEHGYGQIADEDGRLIKASQAAYKVTKGLPQAGHVVRHTCDNPPCCNPSHLIEGTRSDNTQDMLSRGRHYTPFGWKGREHPSAKFSNETLEAVRDDPRSHRAIAAAYGMSKTQVGRVKRGETG